MKILLINKYHRVHAGSERLYFDTAKLLLAQGHEVAFFAMQHKNNVPTEWSRYFADEVDYGEAEKTTLWQKICIAQNILFNFTAKRRLEKLILDFKPDVAHLFNVYHQLSPSIIWALKGKHIPIVMTLCDYKLVSPNYSLFVRGKVWEHSSGFRCLLDRCVKDSFLKSFVCVLEQWIHRLIGTYGKVDVYIGLSQFLIDTYKRLNFPYEIQLLPQPLLSSSYSLNVLPEKKGKKFLYFGRLSEEKGVATLIRSFTELNDGETLSIVGFGPEEERLRSLVKELCLENTIQFLGPVYGDALQNLLKETKAVIVPSEWYENTPYALLETLASGTPVIASRIGSLPERVRDGYNGFLFSPGDAHDLAEKIRSLDTASIPLLQENAQKSILILDEKKYLDTVLSIYSSLIKGEE